MSDPRETLARIRKQADAATEGPWEADWRFTGWDISGNDDDGLPALIASDAYGEDAEFIAAARTDVPWLLGQVEIRDKALESVLELHKPVRASMTSRDGVSDVTVCDHCLDPTWPCQTVAAITTAIGEDHA